MCPGELPSHWLAQVEAIPEMTRALNQRYPKGIERVLERVKRAGYELWLITKGDLVRQAIKVSCFPFLHLFDVVEIVDRKDAPTYRRLLTANHCPPSGLTMVGDAFWEDVVPVVRLGGRAVHVPVGRCGLLRPLERALSMGRVRVCRYLEEVPDAVGTMASATKARRA
jgi:FMN phosphatase YigB (HAD superfamily)